tara:strand:+ start:149 stop:403 length:255 start_codon:yes stop_codon:yes gene_type:complete
MTKFKRTHVTVKEDQIMRIIKFLNRSDDMVNYIRETHDVRLSDVRRLEDGMIELADMFGLQPSPINGNYIRKCDDIDLKGENNE